MPSSADTDLLNGWQRGFPLEPRPFEAIAHADGGTERRVLERFRALQEAGAMDRIGPIFRPHAIGASTLAAIAAPTGRVDEIGRLLEKRRAVNHNYEREHRFNLWFVATGPDAPSVEAAILDIERESGLSVIRLPLLEEFHIDLGFDLWRPSAKATAPQRPVGSVRLADPSERALAAALAPGLPLVERPYAMIGQPEGVVIDALRRWLDAGVVRRVGAIVRHRRLGICANAMAVWDVPDGRASEIGRRLAAEAGVNLCYRRARAPGWDYNLYCMIHGRERGEVETQIKDIAVRNGLANFPHQTLFSRRCFGQRSAWYG